MAKYTFTAPDGKSYIVDAPPGVSEAQARATFQQQLNTGALTNLPVGGQLSALIQAAAGLAAAAALVPNSSVSGIAGQVNKLVGVPVNNGVNTSSFLKMPAPTSAIGGLSQSQVQGLLAQSKLSAAQLPTTVSATSGIGQFGISPQQLEQQGLLKPGTVKTYLSNPNSVNSVLSSPTVWTGKNGVSNLSGFLSNPAKQTTVQQGVMQSSFNSLSKSGVLAGNESAANLGSLIQVASKFGPSAAASFAKGTVPGNLSGEIGSIAKQGQYAVNFVDTKLPIGAAGEVSVVGYNNTVNRSTVNQAVKSILNSNKVPSPNYSTGSAAESALSALNVGSLISLATRLG